MDVHAVGTPARLNDLANGQCFTFEANDRVFIGIKIAYPQSDQSRVFVLNRGENQPPSMQGERETRPSIVYSQPGITIVTAETPHRLRDGVGTPQLGHIAQFENDVYIGFIDEARDLSSASLKTGLINPNRIGGAAAVFDTWQIILKANEESKTLFAFASPGTNQGN